MSLLETLQGLRDGTTGVLVLVVLLLSASQSTARTASSEGPARLSRTEAEILIYLMPASKQLRNDGFDIGWEVREEKDSFHFWVYNAKRKCKEGCSVTVGNYTVNRLTFVITDDDLDEAVSNQEMRGVEAILKRAHHPAGAATNHDIQPH